MDEQDTDLFRLTFADKLGAADLVEELLQDAELDVAHRNDEFSDEAREAAKSMLYQESDCQSAQHLLEYPEPTYDIDTFEGTATVSI